MAANKIIEPNSEVPFRNKVLKIGKILDRGASANVFLAEYDGQPVVVKAIRAESVLGFKSEFKAEAEHLKKINSYWKQRDYPDEPIIPDYIDGDEDAEYPFLIEEFIAGQKLEDAVLAEKLCRFEESKALFLASQIGQLLLILHEDIKKCYGDIKADNFFIVSRSESISRLKVIDWNVLATCNDHNVQKDLLYASAYLFYMVTGSGLHVNPDSLQIDRRLTDFSEFNRLTAGTRQFLEKSCHPVHQFRYLSARNWLADIKRLYQYWQTNPDELLSEAKTARANANNVDDQDERLRSYYDVLAMTEISQALGNNHAGILSEEIKAELSGDKLLERIITPLKASAPDVGKAVRTYKNAQESHQNLFSPDVRLWGWVAQGLQQFPNYSREEWHLLESAMEHRLLGRYEAAYQQFQQFSHVYPDNQFFIFLQKEAEVLSILEKASKINPIEESDFSCIKDYYKEALDSSKELIGSDLFGIEIAGRAIENEYAIASNNLVKVQNALAKLQKAQSSSDADKRVSIITDALNETPSQPLILKPLMEMIVEALNDKQFATAIRLAKIPLSGKYGNDSFEEYRNEKFEAAITAAWELKKFFEACSNEIESDKILKLLKLYVEQYIDQPHEFFIPHAFVQFLKTNFDVVLQQRSFGEAYDTYQAVHTALPEADSQELQAKLNTALSKQIDSYPEPDKLSDEQLKNAIKVVDFRLNLMGDDGNHGQSFRRDQSRRLNLKQKHQDTIRTLRNEAWELCQSYDAVHQMEKFSSPETVESYQAVRKSAFFEIVARLAKIKELDPAFQDAELSQWIKDTMSLDDWFLVRKLADEKLKNEIGDLGRELEKFLQKGELDQAKILLDLLKASNADISPYRSRLDNVELFLEWAINTTREDFEGSQVQYWLNQDIPKVYWERPLDESKLNTKGYFEQYFEQYVSKLLTNYSDENLWKLAWSRQVLRYVSGGIKPVMPSTWKDIKNAAKSYASAKTDQLRGIKKHDLLDLLNRFDVTSVKPAYYTAASKSRSKFVETLKKPWVLLLAGAFGLVVLSGLIFLWHSWAPPVSPTLPATELPGVHFISSLTPDTTFSTPEIVATVSTSFSPEAIATLATPSISEPAVTIVATTIAAPTLEPHNVFWPTSSPINGPRNLPLGVLPQYLLDDSPAVVYNPDDQNVWLPSQDGINGSMRYYLAKEPLTAKPEIFTEWKLDQPIAQNGLYALYVNDPARLSGTSNALEYQVSVEGKSEALIPEFGQSSIKQLFSAEQNGKAEWRCIGMYRLNTGDKLRVHMGIPELVDGDAVGADALMISLVPDVTPELGPLGQPALLNKKVLYWADDAQATFTPADRWVTVQDPATWLGAHKIDLVKDEGASVSWDFTERLSPGEYEIMVFIPAELGVDVSFKVLLNTTEQKEGLKLTLPGKSGFEGTFFSLGKVIVAPSTAPHLKLTMFTERLIEPGTFAYDVAIVVPVTAP